MAQERTVSLRELRQHVRALDQLITNAWMNTGHPAEIDFSVIRKHAGSILDMVKDEPSAPRAATATSPPKAATDKRGAFDASILGLSHVRRG